MSQDQSELDQNVLEDQITSWLTQAKAPGVSIAVVSSTDKLYLKGFGARDRDLNTPVTPDTVFGIGSCTKSVTALAVLQLVDQGDCSLSDSVVSYFPDLKNVLDDEITIRDLLGHATGMPSDGYLSGLLTQLTGRGGKQHTTAVANKADLHRHISKFTDERVTDDEWRFYYNTGYTLLGELIEACTRRSYSEYVKEEILEPLEMSRSCFSRNKFETFSNRMTPYRLENGSLIEDELPFDDLLYAAGGLYSCATDMASYVQTLMQGGTKDDRRIVSEGLVSEMTSGQTDWSTSIDGSERKYGYGVFTEPYIGDTLINHGGMMETTTAWFGFLDDADRGVFIACNTTPDRSLRTLGLSTLALIQDVDPDTVVPQRMLDQKIKPLTGTYETTRGNMSATVTRHAGGVQIQADNPGWSEEIFATPKSLDPNEYEFQSVGDDGMIVPISFLVSGNETTLRVGRWQLHRQNSATE